MSENTPDPQDAVWERDNYEQDQDGIINPEDQLSESGMDKVLEMGYSPPEKPLGLDKFGTTLAEERQGESLDQRLAQEEPDPAMDVDLVEGGSGDVPDGALSEDVLDDGEVGDARAGRLVDPDQGGFSDLEKDLVGSDVGIDGGAASAEEAAMHIVDFPEADMAIERDATERPTLGTS